MQSNESLGVLKLIFPLARAESTWVGHGPCHTFIESCPQGVLWTYRVVIQPESSGWVVRGPLELKFSQYFYEGLKTFLSWSLCSISNDLAMQYLAIQKSIYTVIALFRTHMIFVVNNIPGIGSDFTGDVVMISCCLVNKICPTIQNRIASFGISSFWSKYNLEVLHTLSWPD